jgi:hypothetical protein
VLDDPALVELLHAWGLVIIAPLSIIEGPVVSMLAGYLAWLGAFSCPFSPSSSSATWWATWRST